MKVNRFERVIGDRYKTRMDEIDNITRNYCRREVRTLLDIYKIKITSDGISVERVDGEIITDKEKGVILENMLGTLEKDAMKMTNKMMERPLHDFDRAEVAGKATASAGPGESNKQRLDRIKRSIKELNEELSTKSEEMIEKTRKLKRLETQRVDLERSLKREISDSDSPRCGLPWERFEKEHSEEKFADFVYDLAKKYGRSTLAIRFRLLRLLVDKLPKENLIRKIESMMR